MFARAGPVYWIRWGKEGERNESEGGREGGREGVNFFGMLGSEGGRERRASDHQQEQDKKKIKIKEQGGGLCVCGFKGREGGREGGKMRREMVLMSVLEEGKEDGREGGREGGGGVIVLLFSFAGKNERRT